MYGLDTNGNQNTDEILVTQEKQKQRYDKTHRCVEYEVGCQVMVWTPARKKGKTTKLLHRWHGPYEVKARLSEVVSEKSGIND